MACIWDARIFAGLSTAARSDSRRPQSLSARGLSAKAAARLLARVAAVACEGLLAPCAAAIRSLAICCFCVAVTGEPALTAVRSVRSLAMLSWMGVGAALVPGVTAGWEGGAGWLGDVTPWRTLFWLRSSKARCLTIMGSAKRLLATSEVAPIIANALFITVFAALMRLQPTGRLVKDTGLPTTP